MAATELSFESVAATDHENVLLILLSVVHDTTVTLTPLKKIDG